MVFLSQINVLVLNIKVKRSILRSNVEYRGQTFNIEVKRSILRSNIPYWGQTLNIEVKHWISRSNVEYWGQKIFWTTLFRSVQPISWMLSSVTDAYQALYHCISNASTFIWLKNTILYATSWKIRHSLRPQWEVWKNIKSSRTAR